MTDIEKSALYALLISQKISELFDEERDDCIDFGELEEGDNGTHFTHALLNLAPLHVLKKLSNDPNMSLLACNHLANTLIFQYNPGKHEQP